MEYVTYQAFFEMLIDIGMLSLTFIGAIVTVIKLIIALIDKKCNKK